MQLQDFTYRRNLFLLYHKEVVWTIILAREFKKYIISVRIKAKDKQGRMLYNGCDFRIQNELDWQFLKGTEITPDDSKQIKEGLYVAFRHRP